MARLPVLFLSLFSAGGLLAQGIGNARDLTLTSSYAGHSKSSASKPLQQGTLELLMESPQGTLLGQPLVLVAEFRTHGQAADQILLTEEWDALGVGPNLFILADGTGTLGALLPDLPVLLPGGTILPLNVPDPSSLPDLLQFRIQAVTLDGGAVNGLAVSAAVDHHTEYFPIREETYGASFGRDALLGFRVTSGDLNGDGHVDLIMSVARSEQGGVVDAGSVLIAYGPDRTTTAEVVASTPSAGALFGSALAVGDVDGDGLDDLMVGAREESINGLPSAGAVYVYRGLDLALVARVEAPTPVASADFGHALAALDWNGDGLCDLAVGAVKDVAPGGLVAGRAYVFLAPDFLTSVAIDDPTPQALGRFGYNLSGGDLDGDGFDDLVVGAAFADRGANDDNSGEVHLFFSSGGGTAGLTIEQSLDADAFFGHALAIADTNRDGHLDLVVGAEFADEGGADAGKVSIFPGPSFSAEMVVTSPLAASTAGFGSDVAVGDANGDGYDDLFVGEFYATVDGQARAGRGWILFGPTFDVGKELVSSSPAAFANVGRRMGCGDLDGDGLTDPIVGAPFDSPGGAINRMAGTVVVYR